MEVREYLNVEEDLDGRWCRVLIDSDGDTLRELMENAVIVYEDYQGGESIQSFDLNEVHSEIKAEAVGLLCEMYEQENQNVD